MTKYAGTKTQMAIKLLLLAIDDNNDVGDEPVIEGVAVPAAVLSTVPKMGTDQAVRHSFVTGRNPSFMI